jgi:hypothetical protein
MADGALQLSERIGHEKSCWVDRLRVEIRQLNRELDRLKLEASDPEMLMDQVIAHLSDDRLGQSAARRLIAAAQQSLVRSERDLSLCRAINARV